MKFDIGDFYENLSRKFIFGLHRGKIPDTLYGDVSRFYYCRRDKVVINRSLLAKWYRAVRMAEEVHTLHKLAAILTLYYIPYLVLTKNVTRIDDYV